MVVVDIAVPTGAVVVVVSAASSAVLNFLTPLVLTESFLLFLLLL